MSAVEQETAEELAPSLGGAELAQSLGITYRELDHWTRLGHLRPAGRKTGTGYAREWPESELVIARRIGRLRHAGLPLSFAATMARESWPAGELAPGITVNVTEETE